MKSFHIFRIPFSTWTWAAFEIPNCTPFLRSKPALKAKSSWLPRLRKEKSTYIATWRKIGVLKTSVKIQTPRHLFKNVPSFQTWSFLKCCLKASNVAWWFEVEAARSSQSTLKQTLFQEPYYLYHTICIETTRVTLWWHQRHYYRKITW